MKLNLSSGTNIWNVPSSNSKKALTTSPSARFQALVMQFQLMSSVSCQQDHKTFKPTGLSPVHWQSLLTGITGSRQSTVIQVRAYGMKSFILQEWKLVLWWNAHIFQITMMFCHSVHLIDLDVHLVLTQIYLITQQINRAIPLHCYIVYHINVLNKNCG